MTDPQFLPAPVRAWAESTLGALVAVRPAPPGPSPAGVWHVVRACDDARFQVKIAPTPGAFTRETFAYRHAVPALGPGNAPRLVATSARQLALIVTALPGTPLGRLRPTDVVPGTVLWRAGSLLAQLHQAGRPTVTAYREASSVLSRLADESAHHVDMAGDWLPAEDQKFVMALADRLRVVDRLPLGFVHGGALASSLLWSDGSRAALRDFERSRFAPVVLDFVHPADGLWATRRDTFFDGYGRALGHGERLALRCLTGLRAARSMAEGRAAGDRTAARRGRAVLHRLKNEVSA
ncbi:MULTISPECIES: phosphotransferase [Streptomyces]|uniref:Phosphotransferase n=2 Tax=Streptomyces TaxID=1883 RepID=A0ABV9J5C7_9ACTN